MNRPSAWRRLATMLGGYYLSQALYVVVRLGLAERLGDRLQTAEELAPATGAHARSLHRLLRTLAGFGIFREETGRFRLTELGELLRSDAPDSLRATALTFGETHYPAFGELLHSVQTSRPGFDKVFGMPLFDYFAANPEAARNFDAALEGLRSQATAAMLDVIDLSEVRTLVDVGGGTGGLLATVLARYPTMQGILCDRPHVVEEARVRLQAADVWDRCAVVGGDFFECVPSGGDVYLLRHIIHDWDDERALRILTSCRRAMNRPGKLLLVESVIRADNEPSLGKFYDLLMLALTGGMERTEPEYRELLEAAGFHLTGVVPTSADMDVLEAVPIETGEYPR